MKVNAIAAISATRTAPKGAVEAPKQEEAVKAAAAARGGSSVGAVAHHFTLSEDPEKLSRRRSGGPRTGGRVSTRTGRCASPRPGFTITGLAMPRKVRSSRAATFGITSAAS